MSKYYVTTNVKEVDITILYDGKYPTLCLGNLFAIVDGVKYTFPPYCLHSNGQAWTEDYGPPEEGDWEVVKWPKELPEYLKEPIEVAINEQVPYGCCGGCL